MRTILPLLLGTLAGAALALFMLRLGASPQATKDAAPVQDDARAAPEQAAPARPAATPSSEARLTSSEARPTATIDSLLRLADSDLPAALRAAMALEDAATRDLALRRLAESVAAVDPLGAIATAELIEVEALRRKFRAQLIETWAVLDPQAVLDYLPTHLELAPTSAAAAQLVEMAIVQPAVFASRARDLSITPHTWHALATADPHRLLAVIGRLSGYDRDLGEAITLVALVQWNAAPATAYLEALLIDQPPDRRRERLINLTAQSYARSYPDAAWAWAKSLTPPSNEALRGVIAGAAAADIDRMADFALELAADSAVMQPLEQGPPRSMALMGMTRAMMSSPEIIPALADRFATEAGEHADFLLEATFSRWADSNTEEALEWLTANPAKTVALVDAFESDSLSSNPDLMKRILNMMPAESRNEWVERNVSSATWRRPMDAAKFVASLEGYPEHDVALAAYISGIARNDPAEGARLVERAPLAVQASASPSVASGLAQEDPYAAADWIQRIVDPTVRASATFNVATTWATRDQAAARQWVLGMPSGPARDQGLGGLLMLDARDGSVDDTLFTAMSSDAARADAVATRAVRALAHINPEAARTLIDRYVSDPAQRKEAEQRLEAAVENAELIRASGADQR